MNTFVKYLRNKKLDLDLKDLQDAEAAGEIIGEVAYTIIQRKYSLTWNTGVAFFFQ